MAFELKISLSKNEACDTIYATDTTGLYDASNNPTGYGYPTTGPDVNDITDVRVRFVILGVPLTYDYTVVNGTITAATATLNSGTPINILADLASTVWPFTSANPMNVTPSFYDTTLPTLQDMVWPVTYIITGTHGITPFSIQATDSLIVDCETQCCIRKKLVTVDINDIAKLCESLIPTAYLEVARYSNEDGDTASADDFITKAASLCDGSSNCNCGC